MGDKASQGDEGDKDCGSCLWLLCLKNLNFLHLTTYISAHENLYFLHFRQYMIT